MGREKNGQFRSKCSGCAFTKNGSDCGRCGNPIDGSHRVYCMACYRDYSAEWAKANPEKVKAKMRRHDLMRSYGITPEDYDRMVKEQSGVCAICGGPPQGRGRLHVDHVHGSGSIRALLCSRCNPGIGMFKDNPDLLRAAAIYLERFA